MIIGPNHIDSFFVECFVGALSPLERSSMSTSETKIELVTEAIEALVLASVIAATNLATGDRALNHQNVLDARHTLKGCLKEFLTPSLRIITEHERRVGEISVTSRKTIESIPAPDARPTYPAA